MAFERLGAELSRHGAPSRLKERTRRAAADEVRHARAMHAVAQRLGGAGAQPPAVRVRPMRRRALESLARENAVEGCVRETYGAAVAGLMAQRAADPRLRATMRRIARDEAQHAALAWDIAHWMDAQLDDAARRRVARARARAANALARELRVPAPVADLDALGAPSPRQATALFDALHASLRARGSETHNT